MSIRIEGHEKADEVRDFVERLADFLKVCILYPPSNARVQEAADALIRLQQHLLHTQGKLPLMFDGEGFKIGNTAVESPKANVAWLAHCCEKTHLAGLYFDQDLKNESLYALAHAMHRGIGVSSTATTFDEFWPEKFEGIRLLEMRFRGSFGEFGGDDTEELAEQLMNGLDPESPQAELTTALLESNQELMSSMHELREVANEKARRAPSSAASTAGIHPLRVIVDNLPLVAFEDLDTAAAKVKEVLDQVIQTLETSQEKGSESLEGLTRQIITRAYHSPHEVPQDAEDAPHTPMQHDVAVADAREIDQLLAELQKLPTECPAELTQDDLNAPAEKLGIVLHQYALAESHEARTRLQSLVSEYLRSPSPEAVTVLNQYLHLLCSPRIQPAVQARIAEFAQFIQDSKAAKLLTQFKKFSRQAVLDSFPASFGLFIDSINMRDEKERAKIGAACRAIGVEKIREHREFLGTRTGILAPGRVKKVLALSSRDVLPLVQIVIDCDRNPDLEAIVRYLHAQGLKGPETAALRTISPADRFPREYLSELCLSARGSYPPGLSKTSEMLIHRFIHEPTRSPAQIEQQARAVMALGEFPTRETKELLRNLAKGAGLLSRNKVPKPVHQAAKIALQMFAQGR